MLNTPKGMVSCEKCEQFHETQKIPLPCAEYQKGDEYLIYEGKQQPLCHVILRPEIEDEDDIMALNLWMSIRDERVHGEFPNTLKTIDIIAICQLYEQPIEVFEKIKFIEGLYFSYLLDRVPKNPGEISPESGKQRKPSKIKRPHDYRRRS